MDTENKAKQIWLNIFMNMLNVDERYLLTVLVLSNFGKNKWKLLYTYRILLSASTFLLENYPIQCARPKTVQHIDLFPLRWFRAVKEYVEIGYGCAIGRRRPLENTLKLAALLRCAAIFDTNDRSAFAPRSIQTVNINNKIFRNIILLNFFGIEIWIIYFFLFLFFLLANRVTIE